MGPAPGGAGDLHALSPFPFAHSKNDYRLVTFATRDSEPREECIPSGFAADVARSRSLRRRLFIKADALTFVQLLERAGLHRATVKKPLLAAIVANESKSAITDQPFNRAVRHVDVPPGTVDGPSWGHAINIHSTIRQTWRSEISNSASVPAYGR